MSGGSRFRCDDYNGQFLRRHPARAISLVRK